jgi:putative SOS response-associated peptidase YedK
MCGRFALYTPPTRAARFLDAVLGEGLTDDAWDPSWNVPPTEDIVGARTIQGRHSPHPDGSEARVLEPFRWGLVPSWAKDLSTSNRNFNARAETVTSKPSFRSAFDSRRLLVPADGFYEWQKRGSKRQPYFFERTDGELMAFAGLWERWRASDGPEPGPWVLSCTIITTGASSDIEDVHDRMPVILEPDVFEAWLDPHAHGSPALEALLAPAPPGTLRRHEVGTAVGNVTNNGPELIKDLAT